jgi:hypothetical protein
MKNVLVIDDNQQSGTSFDPSRNEQGLTVCGEADNGVDATGKAAVHGEIGK